jgi:hypothetical protein
MNFHTYLSIFMDDASKYRFSGPVNVFQERQLAETATSAGYSALIDAYALAVPLLGTLTASIFRMRMTRAIATASLTQRRTRRSSTPAFKRRSNMISPPRRIFFAATIGSANRSSLSSRCPSG